MKNEIKETLDYFRKFATIRENVMIDEIEDYITNLQEVIERLNKELDTAINICNARQKEIVRLNNIINELEKDMRETMEILKTTEYQKIDIDYVIETLDIYCNRLKELKEGKINDR